MMMYRQFSIALVGVFFSISCLAAWMPLKEKGTLEQTVDVIVSVNGSSGTELNVVVPGIVTEESTEQGGAYQKIALPGEGVLSRPGSPLVPAIRRNIIVPRDARVQLDMKVLSEAYLRDYQIYPAQPTYKRSEEKPDFMIDQAVYSNDDYYPADIARITNDAILRDFRFVTVTITPVQYNPVTREVRIITGLEINITTGGMKRVEHDVVFPAFREVYRRVFANYEQLNIGTRTDAEPMLIICHDLFQSEMAAFVEWKTKRGVDVTMVSSTETGTTASAIQSYIQNVWNTWNPQPVYIVLVGDAPQLQPLTGVEGCASDSMFTLLEGGDLYPDVFISRLCALSTSELNAQLDKILTYEMTPPETIWLDRFAGLASSEGSGPSDEEYSQEMEARFLAHNPDAVADRIYQSMGHGAAEISAAVNAGRFWLSYIGHGSGTSWSAPSFSNSNVDALTNGDFTPFIMDVSCSNGSFAGSSDCFAERWMKNAGKGAVGMFSASTSCSWDEPAVMAWGVTYSVCGDTPGTIPGGEYLFGQMTCNGYLHMFDVFGTGSNTEEVMNQYVLFGDCSGMFRSDASITPDVDHLPTAPMAPVPFTVTVTDGGSPLEGAFVCAYKPGDVHEVAETDASGVAVLEIAPITVGDMIITVYGQNLTPQESIVMVAPAGCGVVVLDAAGYNCNSTVGIRVFDSDLNANPGAVETAEVEIWSDSEPTPETLILTETGPDTATFYNSILTSDTLSGPGWLLVENGDLITVHYHDADCDGDPADVYDTADVDCQFPIISGVMVSNVGTDTATISWTTDEPATSVLFWGESTPPANMIEDLELTTSHSITLDELEVCTEYHFYVQSADLHANTAVDDNGGAFYNFTTLQLMLMLEANMDIDPGWTYTGQWAWGTPQGSGGDPSSGYTGSNVVGYNLAGSYANSIPVYYATTQAFDCSGASQAFLGFWRWLGVESATWDHASVEISNDGGSSWNIIWNHTGETVQDTSWTYQEYDISDWAAGHGNVIIRWGMGPSDSVVAYCGWNLDDVMVSYTAPCNVPILVYGDHTIDDSMGNNDGQINGGEHIAMTVTLDNLGLSATGVSAVLSTTNPHVTITQNATTFPDIPQSGSGTADLAFEFDVDPAAEDGEAIPFSIAWTCTENSGSTAMTEMVVAPELVITGYQIEEVSGGENDGIWEPGETVRILVTVMNDGYGTAHDISGVLSSNLPAHVTVDTDTAVWTDIAGGDTATCLSPYFMVTASSAIPDPSTVTFTVEFTAEGYTGDGTFMMDCTSSNFARRYMWNMDTDPMWTTENQWAWGVPQGLSGDPSSGYTGTHVYGYNLAGNYENNLPETHLTTAPIDCSGLGDVELRFMRWLGMESATYDHAYVRVSNDGVNWTTIWSHTGSSFTDPTWQTMVYDISAVADDQPAVYIRWVMGTTDYIVAYCGWNIDDVEIWADSLIPTPTPPCIHHGDVNLDNQITAVDAQMAFQIALMMMTPTFEQACAADCNGDDENTAGDAQGVFMAALGMGSCVDPLPEKRAAVELIQQYRRPELVIDADADLIWAGNVSGRAGEPVTVGILLDNPMTSVDAFTLNLGYDRTRMELEEIREGDLNPGWVDFGWNESQPGIVTVAAYGSGLSDGAEIAAGSAGTLLEVSFRLTADCTDTAVTLLSIHDDLSGFGMP